MDLHRLAEERSIEYHRRIAHRMREDLRILDRARERVRAWRRDGSVAPDYAREWDRALALDIEDLCALLVDRGEHARALRQVTPFAGALDPRERWRVWREVRDREAQDRT